MYFVNGNSMYGNVYDQMHMEKGYSDSNQIPPLYSNLSILS